MIFIDCTISIYSATVPIGPIQDVHEIPRCASVLQSDTHDYLMVNISKNEFIGKGKKEQKGLSD